MRTRPTIPRFRGALLVAALLLAMASVPALAEEPAEPQGEEEADAPAAGEAPPEAPAAAPAPPTFSDIEVITIRGRHHDDLLQDTAVSVTSFDTKELDDLRIQNIADLAEYTPNLDINTRSAASNPTLFIRGIGLKDYNANAAGAVAVYQDGININAPAIQLFQLFDVASVEVLRGPQGSGSGRNASAGAIKVNSVQPDGLWGGSASFTYGNYNTIQAEGALNLPLIEDMLSARFAFTANFRDGITDNECADWNPEAHGFDRVTQDTITTAYTKLTARLPADQQHQPLRFAVRPGPNGNGPTQKSFIYVRSAEFGSASAFSAFLRQNGVPLGRLDQDQAVDPVTGAVVARRNDLVGIQVDTFTQNAPVNVPNGIRVDGACILQPPGNVVTRQGTAEENPEGKPRDPTNPKDKPYPLDQANQFLRTNVPALDDFQGLKERVNNVDDWAGRGILRFQPRDDMEWSLNAHGGRNRSDSRHLQMIGANVVVQGDRETCVFCEELQDNFSEKNAAQLTGLEGLTEVDGLLIPAGSSGVPGGQTGADPFSGWYNRDGTEFLDAWGTSLRGTWDLGSIVVTSLGGYEWYDRFIEDEGDANPANVFPADWSDSAWQVSQELRADFEGERYRWSIGGLFLQEKLTATNLFPDTQNFRIEQTFDQKLWSVAPYVGGRYELTEELGLESGIRYNVEHKDFTLASTTVASSGVARPEIQEEQIKKTWTGVTGDVTLSYTPYWSVLDLVQNDNLNFYVKYGRGMKAGHFNAGLTIQNSEKTKQRIIPVEPEFIHAAEVGFKSGWLDNRLVVNVAGFRYWYKDLQVFDITNEIGELPLQKLLNSDARVWGAEVEFQARPLPGLSIQGGLGWLYGHFKDFTVEKAIGLPRGLGSLTTFDYDGNPLIAAPRYSVSAVVDYEIPLGAVGSLIPGYDFSWRSKVYLDAQALDPISQPAYWVHNARLAYRTPDGRIEVAGWVENLTNQYYKEDVFDLTRDFDTILEVWADPRTYGVTVTYTW